MKLLSLFFRLLFSMIFILFCSFIIIFFMSVFLNEQVYNSFIFFKDFFTNRLTTANLCCIIKLY